jgi:multidrug efflux pump subunit AcrA (membrane-fusion protein)
MKLNNIVNKFKNFSINKERLQSIIPYLVPEYWASNKKSFILFWMIGSFTIIFLIWASIAEVNQVVRAQGKVIPDSKVQLIQTGIKGPVEDIKVKLDDKVKVGDVLFLINHQNNDQLYNLSLTEVETRSRKVDILGKLVESGSDSEFRLLDEKLALIEAQKRFDLAKLNRGFSIVKSQINGTVSKVNVRNKGQVVSSGATLAEIVPEDDVLLINASILPKDIAYVRAGQSAKIGFTSYDIAIYGQIDGSVKKIAANTTTTEEGQSFYEAMIEVDVNQIKETNDIILQPGMIADVSIIGEERTVMSYIMNPITKLSKRALQE